MLKKTPLHFLKNYKLPPNTYNLPWKRRNNADRRTDGTDNTSSKCLPQTKILNEWTPRESSGISCRHNKNAHFVYNVVVIVDKKEAYLRLWDRNISNVRTYIRTYEHAHFVEIQIVLSSRNAFAVDGTVVVVRFTYITMNLWVCVKRSWHQFEMRMLIFQGRLLEYKSRC